MLNHIVKYVTLCAM